MVTFKFNRSWIRMSDSMIMWFINYHQPLVTINHQLLIERLIITVDRKIIEIYQIVY